MREWIDRVDDAILAQVGNLARLRRCTVRGALADFRATALEIADTAEHTPDEEIWRLRIERCNVMLSDPDDKWLRRRVSEAMEHDR